MQPNSIIDCNMNATFLAPMILCQRNYRVRSHAMRPLCHSINQMLNSWITQISRYRFPSLGKNVRIMDRHIAICQIKREIRRKLLYHVHSSLYNLEKGYSRSCRRVVANGKQLIAALITPDKKSRAVIGT